jgi:hypothetical protein
MTISKAEGLAYLSRWQLVNQAEIRELRSTSMETKARQLAALMESRTLFRDDPMRQEDVQGVRDRWARLRQVLGG